MIPIKDENPTRRFPVVTVLLLVANIFAFAYELTLSEAELHAFIDRWAVNASRLAVDPLSLANLVTLFTAIFLHAGWLHLGGNMLYLWIFGNNVEDRLGRVAFIAFYLGCGILATLAQMLVVGPVDVPLLGASGAIAGVLGAYLLLFPRVRVVVVIPVFFIIHLARVPAAFVIGFWFLIQVVQGVGSISPEAMVGGVAWWAHIGGFVSGFVLALPAWLADLRERRRREQESRFTTWR